MASDINGISSSIVQLGQQTARLESRVDGDDHAARGTRTDSDDRLSLTDSAYNLRDLESRIHQLPVADGQRIDEVRRAVAAGSYRVDPATTADRLLGMEQALAKPMESQR